MKPIVMTESEKKRILTDTLQRAQKALEEYSISDGNMSFEMPIETSPKDKIVISFTPGAYLKCQELVKEFPGEVGWHGLVRREDDAFVVYDVLIPEQQVSGARVIDPSTDNEWFESMTDDQLEHLHFQAHSHVNFSTSPSDTDLRNQKNIVQNMGGEGFYIFQIWNKSGDINTFVYDLDNNLFYTKEDIIVDVQDETYGTLESFKEMAKKLVSKIEYTYKEEKKTEVKPPYTPSNVTEYKPISYSSYNYCSYNQSGNPYSYSQPEKKSSFYWNDGMGHEGWD